MKSFAIFFAFVVSASCSRHIIEPEVFVAKLFNNVAERVRADPGVLTIEDFVGEFDKTLLGKQFQGKVTFNSGFVNR
jgi:hypothetical protein